MTDMSSLAMMARPDMTGKFATKQQAQAYIMRWKRGTQENKCATRNDKYTPGTFPAYDYEKGYQAGANDAYWAMVRYAGQRELAEALAGGQ